MARKTKKDTESIQEVEITEAKENIEEVVTPVITEQDVPKAVDFTPEPLKNIIIAKSAVPLRRLMNLSPKYVVGYMKPGTAYEIVREAYNSIYGKFYLLNNGYYVTQGGPYTFF